LPRYYPIDWQLQDTAYACLEVTDSGRGIAEKDIEKIFDPFFTSNFSGRGLGLPVALGILRAHRGAMEVESQPGVGSIFRVFLPVSAEEVAHPPEPGLPGRAGDIEAPGALLNCPNGLLPDAASSD
jgi:two-component system, cell cycle sensor histidine kinase and response regulator CckA